MRRNERFRLYRESHGAYLLVLVGKGRSPSGMYDCIGELRYFGDVEHPILASSQVSPDYLRHRCKRVAQSDLPAAWRRGFEQYVEVA